MEQSQIVSVEGVDKRELPKVLQDLQAKLSQDRQQYTPSERDKQLGVRFFTDYKFLDQNFQRTGKIEFLTRDMIEITIPDDIGPIPETHVKWLKPGSWLRRMLTEDRFPEHWAKYLSQRDGTIGTPLSVAAPSMAEAIHAVKLVKISTIEQIVEADDETLSHLPGAIELKKAAERYKKAQDGLIVAATDSDKLQRELDAALKQIAQLQEALEGKENGTEENDSPDMPGRSGSKESSATLKRSGEQRGK